MIVADSGNAVLAPAIGAQMGMFEGKILEADKDRLMERITEDSPNRRKVKQVLNDKELREFIVECKEVVDKAEIPDEEFSVNPAEELKRIIEVVRTSLR